MSLAAFIVSTALSLVATLLGVLYWYSTSTFHYWKKKGVPFARPIPLLGNVKDTILLRRNFNEVHRDLYNTFDGHRFVGIFMGRRPTLMLRDPDLIRNVLVSDFVHFHDRDVTIYADKFPLQQSILNLKGHQWKNLRKRLSPSFSSARLKYMFPLLHEASKKLVSRLQAASDRAEIINMRDALTRFASDTAGSCIYGLHLDALDNPNSVFFRKSQQVLERTLPKRIAQLVNLLLPEFGHWLSLDGFGSDVADFFLNLVKSAADFRVNNNINQNDFLDSLINLRYNGCPCEETVKKENGLINNKMDNRSTIPRTENWSINHKTDNLNFEFDDGMMAAQPFIFSLAGFVNSSNCLGFAIHELAVNPTIQTKLREEIDAILEENGGEFTLASINNMKYLDRVVSETCRKYPIVQFLRRAVTKEYTIPGTTVTLDAGTPVIVPLFALHRDPKHFPHPDRFDPERFSEQEKAKRHKYAFLPFGEGPRNCIGIRFSLLQVKLGLAALLAKFEFHICDETRIPLQLSPRSFVLESSDGYIVRIMNRC